MTDQDDPNAVLAKYNASHQENGTSTQHPPVPGLEFLGRGYDVFGRYASVDSCKQNIIDFSGADQTDQMTLNRSVDSETLAKAFNQIPIQIVRIFEKHGFIWGGFWYHFDTMHFEYRPELLPNRPRS